MENRNYELHEKLSRLRWLSKQRNKQRSREHGPMADTSRGQGRVLAVLKLQPEISSRDLAYLLDVRPQSLNELLGKLESSGYVTRSQSEADRRVTLVKITEKGKEEPQPNRDCSDIFACLSDDEAADMNRYLERIISSLEEELGDSIEDAESAERMWGVRERMGDEHFQRLMAMGEGFRHGRHSDGGRGGKGKRQEGGGRNHHRQGSCAKGEFQENGCGKGRDRGLKSCKKRQGMGQGGRMDYEG